MTTAATTVARYDFFDSAERSVRARNTDENTDAYRVERDDETGNWIVVRDERTQAK